MVRIMCPALEVVDIDIDEMFPYKGPESAAITDPNFWRFNIWDPRLSSTTTTTTTPPTTGTVTTRPLLSTTANTLVILKN